MKKILNILIMITMSLVLFSCSDTDNRQAITSIDDLKDKRIGIKQGTIYDSISKRLFPDAQFFYFNNDADLTVALKGNKIDGFAGDDAIITEIVNQNPEIAKIGEHVSTIDVCLVFAKNEKGEELAKKMNVLIKELKDNGELDRLYDKWLNYDSNTKSYDLSKLTGENGTITLATQTGAPPFNILLNGKVTGYEIELTALFCEKYGYKLVINEMYFDGLLPSVQTGKADIAAGGIGKTEERAKSVTFCDPIALVYGSVCALKQDVNNAGLLDYLIKGFNSTFILEDRWKLFVNGILSTIVITVISIILGTLLGFVVFTNTRNNKGLALKIVRLCIWVIQGMPMVVLLMVLYYVVFGKVSINSFWVSILGFTLTFGCSVFNMLSGAVETIDKGQAQAAFTLGYSEKRSFYKIILPQAIRFVIPSYKSEIVSLIKATAVVGYIAVQDLTKVGDLVRSRTYEAFFPLIVITVLYFVLAGILTAILDKIDLRFDLRKRTPEQILKGVKTK